MKYTLFENFKNIINLFKSKMLFSNTKLIRFPFYIRGKKYIKWGKNFTTGYNCRIDALPLNKNIKFCIEIGENCQLNDNCHIGAVKKIKIGNDVLIASRVFISDHNHGFYGDMNIHDSPDTKPLLRKLSYKEVIIEDNVWIGEGVCVLPGVHIGKGSIIGANSVVSKNIPPFSIAVGIPAKVIKRYDFNKKEWIKI